MSLVERFVEGIQRLPPIARDRAMGVGIFAIGSVALVLPGDAVVVPTAQRPAALGILALEALGVSLRRKRLWVACGLIVIASASGLFTANEVYATMLSRFVLLYTVSERCSLAVSLLALLADPMMDYLAGWWADPTFPLGVLADVVLPYAALVWFAGRAQARRRLLAADLERSGDELRDERDRLARGAVGRERARIGRDLHTLVVRGVERMSATTRAARRELNSDRGRPLGLIGEIEATGRRALAEMRRLLLVLRAPQDSMVPSSAPEAPRAEPASPSDDDGPPGVAPLRAGTWRPAPRLVQQTRRLVAIPWVTDALVVFVMAILAVGERLYDPFWLQRRSAVVLGAVVVGALLFRRVAPVGVLLLIASVIFVQNAFLGGDTNTADRAILVAVFTVATLRGPWWGLVAIVAQVVAYVPYLLIPDTCGVACQVGWTGLFVFAVIAGIAVRESRRLNGVLLEQNDLLRRTREERVRLAVDEERTRIARDVHDMVAHGVTLMVIQAGAARWLAESDPLQAEKALSAVEQAGQEALRELHSLVGSLDGGPVATEPLPTGEQLTIRSLVDHEIEAGMHVELIVGGERSDLDPGLEISLYRIVQEALTNVRKHAPGARAWVELRYTPEGVEVEVTDAGGTTTVGSPTLPGAGQGLVGITERAALFGGRAEAGPTPEGGFRVRATLAGERVLV